MSLAEIPFEETRAPEPPGPPLAALLEGGEARQRWLRHWVRDPVQGALNLCTHHGLRLLPSDACSRLGAVLAPLARRHNAKRIFAQRIERNLKALRPDLAADPAAADRALVGWWPMSAVFTQSFRLSTTFTTEPDRTARHFTSCLIRAPFSSGKTCSMVARGHGSTSGRFRCAN